MRRLLATLLVLVATPALASDPHTHHAMPKVSGKLAGNKAVGEYVKADKAMHTHMDICYTGDADVDFVEGMIPHHQGAVDMAKVELKYGKDETMRTLASRIITAQEYEISLMNTWIAPRRSAWKAKDLDTLESVKGYRAAMEKMHKDMHIKYTGNADVDFARGMIPHHQGAIEMAEVLRKHGRDFGLRKMADDIIRSQGQEIRLMQEWLEQKGSGK